MYKQDVHYDFVLVTNNRGTYYYVYLMLLFKAV